MLNYTLYEKHHPIPSYPVLGERFPQITVGAVVLYLLQNVFRLMKANLTW